jgi:hypothetical protein
MTLDLIVELSINSVLTDVRGRVTSHARRVPAVQAQDQAVSRGVKRRSTTTNGTRGRL